MGKKPIILIPGIQGTRLRNANDHDFKVMWSAVKKYFSNIHDLKLQFDGVTDLGTERIVERADVEDIAYSEIINYLRSLGYKVYIFGYDWRKSNTVSAEKLGELIDYLTNKLNNSSFNFITHSMGGLVLSAYIKRLTIDQRNTIINKAIMTVPPFLGSIEACFNLTIGKSKLFNSSDDFRKVARTFPAIYELLPVYKGAYGFENSTAEQSYNPYDFSTYWQQVRDLDPRRKDTAKKHRLISNRLQKLGELRDENDFIFDFSQCDASFLSRFIVIAGTRSKTKQKVFVKNKMGHIKNFFDFEHYDETREGDGTVPLESAIVFKDSITTFKVEKSISLDWHALILNSGRIQNVITRFLRKDENALRNNDTWYQSIGDRRVKKVT